jgi:tetratricopeptide (TPR) repeat protein
MFLSGSLLIAAPRGDDYFNRGIVYILIDDASLATENINRYFNINPNPALRSGFLEIINKNNEGATTRFRNYLNINQRSTAALVGIALSTANMEVSNTIEVLKRALRLNLRYSPAYLSLGVEYMKKKNFPLAEINIKKAFNYSKVPEFKIILAKLYLAMDNPEAAVGLLKSEADITPDNFHYNFLSAQAFYKLNNLRRTGKYIEAALIVNPGNNDANLLMSKYLIGINELQKAYSILNGLRFKTYNKDYVKTYAHVLLELKDRNVEDYLYEFFALDKWDKDINRLLGGYYLWHKGRGNVQNFITRAILSGEKAALLKKAFPGDYRFDEYKFIPFFNIKTIKWISESLVLAVAEKNSGDRERILIIDTESLRVIKTFDFRGKFQKIFLPQNYSGSGNINFVLSAVETESGKINLYGLRISGRNIILNPVFNRPQVMSAPLIGFNIVGNLAYITDAAISSIAFESPFSKISPLGRKSPVYPIYPFHIYQYNFNNSSLKRVDDPEQLRGVPIKKIREFFLVADAYQYNEDIKGLIKKGEKLDLTSDEVVRTYIPDDLSSFIIYLADLKNAFQAIIYDSKNNRIKKVDETMFLGQGQYAEVKVLDFHPKQHELVVITKDKDRRLINFNYNSFLYMRLAKSTHDFFRDEKFGSIFILTERRKRKYYIETNLDVISLNPYYMEKIRTRYDLNKILYSDESNHIYFSTYNGELLKMDAEYKFHYVAPSFEGAICAVSPVTKKKAVFINERLIFME